MHLLTTGMGQICTSTYADTVTQLERVMKDLRELNPEAQILVLSYNNPVPLMPSWSRHFRRLNTAAAKLAAQYDVTYVPIPIPAPPTTATPPFPATSTLAARSSKPSITDP